MDGGNMENKMRQQNILCVEDSDVCYRIVEKTLQNNGFAMSRAHNAKEALDMIASQDISLILMDIKLPGISGYEATQRIRDSGNNTPIVAITAYGMKEDKEKCLAAGCDDYISKPYSLGDLRSIVLKYTSKDTEGRVK